VVRPQQNSRHATLVDNCGVFRVSVLEPGHPSGPAIPGPSRPCHFPPKATRAWPDCNALPLWSVGPVRSPLPPTGDLQTGSVLVRKGDYLILVAYFPGSSAFKPKQLVPFVGLRWPRCPADTPLSGLWSGAS